MNLTEQGMDHILWDSLDQYISLIIFSISISIPNLLNSCAATTTCMVCLQI